MAKKIGTFKVLSRFLVITLFSFTVSASDYKIIPLSIAETEHLALTRDPELKRLQANSEALDEQAIADGQLEDPKLIVGAINVPTNTFSFTQDDMTMMQVGVQQSFPSGNSLLFKSEKTKALGEAEHRQTCNQSLLLLRDVRHTWLDLYYWENAKRVTRENKNLFSYLVKEAKSLYSVGKTNQTDLLQAQVELTKIDDQDAQITQKIAELRAKLGRWIGREQANRPLPSVLPNWSSPPSLANLKIHLQQHPLLRSDAAKIQAGRFEVAFSQEQYKPGVMVDVGYGVRQGRMTDGRRRSDMATAQVTIDLPIFTSQRQSKRLQASTLQLTAVEMEQEVHYLDLMEALNTQYASWQNYTHRIALFKQHLIPEARLNAKAALTAFQSATTDIIPVVRANMVKLEIELQELQLGIEQKKARADLLYLERK